ncbi:hypothetical protein [Baaleninema simplex]|uniref:hypothetical protein n=1 Tax=Baaleninema simplex TaxID=2862350 RepID=UPI000348549A|nr:hypothetical protein [Baaleninema simplex]
MTTQVLSQPATLDEMFACVWTEGYLTRDQRKTLMSVVLSSAISDRDREVLDRIFHAVRRGWLKLLD